MTDTPAHRVRCVVPYSRVIHPDGLDSEQITRLTRRAFARLGVTLPDNPELDVRNADEDELAVAFKGRPHEGMGAHIVEHDTDVEPPPRRNRTLGPADFAGRPAIHSLATDPPE